MSHYPQRYVVIDGEGEPLRKFRSKQSAHWFMENKPECKLVELDIPKPKKETNEDKFNNMLNKVGECLF